MALAAGSFSHMPVLPTLKYASKKSMTINIKCANNNKNKTKVAAGKKPTGSTGNGGFGKDPTSTNDGYDEHNKNKTKVNPKKPIGSTGSGGLGIDPQTENPLLPTYPPKNSDDDEDQDNTSAFNLPGNE